MPNKHQNPANLLKFQRLPAYRYIDNFILNPLKRIAITEQDLKKIFDAEKAKTEISQEEKAYLKNRSKLVSDMYSLVSIDKQEYFYELFCEYGLEEKMLKKVEPNIRYLSRFEPHKLLESSFYKRFMDEKFVPQYVEENINLKN